MQLEKPTAYQADLFNTPQKTNKTAYQADFFNITLGKPTTLHTKQIYLIKHPGKTNCIQRIFILSKQTQLHTVTSKLFLANTLEIVIFFTTT